MEETRSQEEAREALAREYPVSNLFVDAVAIYGFLTVSAFVGWFLAGVLILLRIGSPQPVSPGSVVAFVVCVILNVIFGRLTAVHARRQRKRHTHSGSG